MEGLGDTGFECWGADAPFIFNSAGDGDGDVALDLCMLCVTHNNLTMVGDCVRHDIIITSP